MNIRSFRSKGRRAEDGSGVGCWRSAQDLADKLARDCRSIMMSAWYRQIFRTRLAAHRNAVQEFITTTSLSCSAGSQKPPSSAANRNPLQARYRTMTLSADEFIRRFLLHVLPKGFHRIRHYGLLASAGCKANIARAEELMAAPMAPVDPPAVHDTADPHAATDHRPPCPCCGGRIRGGGTPYSNMAWMPTERMDPPPELAADAHDCIMVRTQRSYRIQVCGTKMRPNGELPSHPQ